MIKISVLFLIFVATSGVYAEDVGPCTKYPKSYCYEKMAFICKNKKDTVRAEVITQGYGQEGDTLSYTSKIKFIDEDGQINRAGKDREWVDWSNLPDETQKQYKKSGLWIDTGWVYPVVRHEQLTKSAFGTTWFEYDEKVFSYFFGTNSNSYRYKFTVNLRSKKHTLEFARNSSEQVSALNCVKARFK